MIDITVVVADDHPVYRGGLRAALAEVPGVVVVAEAATGADAATAAVEHQADVVLMDLAMPGGTGIEAITNCDAAARKLLVLALTMHDDPVTVAAAVAAGARGSRRAALVSGVSCESIALIVTVVSLRWSAPLSDQYVRAFAQAVDGDAPTERSSRRSLTSDSRNLRCPPGVRIDPMRPDAAHLVTVFGSTRNIRATSPGVSNRSWMSIVTGYLLLGPERCHGQGLMLILRRQCGSGARPNYAFMSESERSGHRPIPDPSLCPRNDLTSLPLPKSDWVGTANSRIVPCRSTSPEDHVRRNPSAWSLGRRSPASGPPPLTGTGSPGGACAEDHEFTHRKRPARPGVWPGGA